MLIIKNNIKNLVLIIAFIDGNTNASANDCCKVWAILGPVRMHMLRRPTLNRPCFTTYKILTLFLIINPRILFLIIPEIWAKMKV